MGTPGLPFSGHIGIIAWFRPGRKRSGFSPVQLSAHSASADAAANPGDPVPLRKPEEGEDVDGVGDGEGHELFPTLTADRNSKKKHQNPVMRHKRHPGSIFDLGLGILDWQRVARYSAPRMPQTR